jgi:hypothetical protein
MSEENHEKNDIITLYRYKEFSVHLYETVNVSDVLTGTARAE